MSMADIFRDVPESDEEKLKRFGREIHFPSLLHPVRPFQEDEGELIYSFIQFSVFYIYSTWPRN